MWRRNDSDIIKKRSFLPRFLYPGYSYSVFGTSYIHTLLDWLWWTPPTPSKLRLAQYRKTLQEQFNSSSPKLQTLSHRLSVISMALKLPYRSFRAVSCSVSVFPSGFSSPYLSIAVQRRRLSDRDSPHDDSTLPETERPRWSYTPPAAKAPFSLHLDSKRPEFSVNEDPAILDRFYIRILGKDGDKLLSDEIKWLAVTHKSFDQGRRGFNDRLAFLGMSKSIRLTRKEIGTHFSLPSRQTDRPAASFIGPSARCRQLREEGSRRSFWTNSFHPPCTRWIDKPLPQHQEFPYGQVETIIASSRLQTAQCY